jgi:ADP-ribose pyrophosphatase YjhB (NUDIX family)
MLPLVGPRDPCLAAVFIPAVRGFVLPVFQRESKCGTQIWHGLPGGKRERGDRDARDTVIREYLEELGIHVHSPEYKTSMPHPYVPDAQCHFFTAVYGSGTPENLLPQEHKALFLPSPCVAVSMLAGRIPAAMATLIARHPA